jgi:2-amino-4-hydroxy-6-hydroxymethyldihydropteridine diphosphokinase
MKMCTDSTTKCLIALGGNIGPVEQNFVLALDKLADAECRIVTRSRYYQSVPMGSDAGKTFVNAAALVQTNLSPLELLELLQKIEKECGRVRSVHWGPRTLDLDLLFYGQQILQSERLTVPHLGLWYRRFVLKPLLEIAPSWKHPVAGHTVKQLYQRLVELPLIIEVSGTEVLPTIPDRYPVGTVEIWPAVVEHRKSTAAQDVFCRLHVKPENEPASVARVSEFRRFEMAAESDTVDEVIDAILVAALGH